MCFGGIAEAIEAGFVFGDDQEVDGCLGGDVSKRHAQVVLIVMGGNRMQTADHVAVEEVEEVQEVEEVEEVGGSAA